jgi:hypothetical protein
MVHIRVAFVLALSLLTARIWAQSAERVEIYGGYSYASNEFTGGTLTNNGSLTRGWNVSANVKLNRFSQFVADYGGYYLPLSSGFCIGVSSCSSNVHTLMFGPQLSFRSKVTPFVHALFGVALASQTDPFHNLASNHSFVMALGGGVDYGITRHFGIRGQADYLQTHFTNNDNQDPFHNSHVRISGGLVVRF